MIEKYNFIFSITKITFPLCDTEILINVTMNYNLQVKPVNSQTSPSLSPYLWKDLTVDVAEIPLQKLQYFHKLFISTL